MRVHLAPVTRLPRLLRRLISEGAFILAMALALVCMLTAIVSAEQATVALDSDPGGARIELDGVVLGFTPLVATLTPGLASRAVFRLDEYIPAVVQILASETTPDQVRRAISVTLTPELEVPYGFDFESVPHFLKSREEALELVEEVADDVALGHIDRPVHALLLAHAAAALFDGIEAVRAQSIRRRQVLGDEAVQLYGRMLELDGVPGVVCALHDFGEGEALLEISVAGEGVSAIPFSDSGELSCGRALASAFDLARKLYDPARLKVTDDALAVLAIRGLLASLEDRHCRFFPPSQSESYADENEGHVSGVGLQLGTKPDGTVVVLGAIANSPGARSGILPGDALLSVDRSPTTLFELDAAVRDLRGPEGSSVTLSLARGDHVLDPVTLVRELVPVHCSTSFYFEDRSVGYLRIDSFPGPWVIDEVQQSLDSLLGMGMTGLVIDLRGNAGGLLDQAAAVADLFIDEGVLVSTVSPLPRIQCTVEATKEATIVPPALKVVVLVDDGTASAAEILAGCLRDHNRAQLVGLRTYGKGSVQVILPLGEDRGSLALTVGRYTLPSGATVHHVGVAPDVTVPIDQEVQRRLRARSLYSHDDPRLGDPQLETAMACLATAEGDELK